MFPVFCHRICGLTSGSSRSTGVGGIVPSVKTSIIVSNVPGAVKILTLRIDSRTKAKAPRQSLNMKLTAIRLKL